jgi:hypothetical protein
MFKPDTVISLDEIHHGHILSKASKPRSSWLTIDRIVGMSEKWSTGLIVPENCADAHRT